MNDNFRHVDHSLSSDFLSDTAIAPGPLRRWSHRTPPPPSEFLLHHGIAPIARMRVAEQQAQKDVSKIARRIKRLHDAGKLGKARKLAGTLALSKKAHIAAAGKVVRRFEFAPGTGRHPTAYEAGACAHDRSRDGGDVHVIVEPKTSGGSRTTNDYGLVDRVRQRAVANAYSSLLTFHRSQYGCRGTSPIHDAVKHVDELTRCDRYSVWCEMDISNCFGSVDVAMLASELKIPSSVVSQVISNEGKGARGQLRPANENAYRQWNGIIKSTETIRTPPQGASTSSLFVFSLLRPALEAFEARFGMTIAIVVYCDNVLLLGSERAALEEAKEFLRELIASIPAANFVLMDKTATRPLSAGIKFLGHRFMRRAHARVVSKPEHALRYRKELRSKIANMRRGICSVENVAKWALNNLPTFNTVPTDRLELTVSTIRALKRHRSNRWVNVLFAWMGRNIPDRTTIESEYYKGRRPRVPRARFPKRLSNRLISVPKNFRAPRC